jgi:very-short-patch-repair endonuclease
MNDPWFEQLLKGSQDLLIKLLENACNHAGLEKDYESPIEYVLACAMCAAKAVDYPNIGFMKHRSGIDHAKAKEITETQSKIPVDHPLWACVFPQVTIGEYRVDFFIAYTHGLNSIGGIVVECDGHEFHEKTKQQAARDKARDRALQSYGYRVFRFTGSEIWRNPIACAQEVLEFADSQAVSSQHSRWLAEEGDMKGAVDSLKWSL